MRYWTADAHFGHANIVRYCHRPIAGYEQYVDANGEWRPPAYKNRAAARVENNKWLLDLFNGTAVSGDEIIHVGDYYFGGKLRQQPLKPDVEWTMFLGNHDRKRDFPGAMESAVLGVADNILALVRHTPVSTCDEVPRGCDLVICGHVHDSWGTCVIDGVVHVNVGIDAWHRLLTDSDIARIYNECLTEARKQA